MLFNSSTSRFEIYGFNLASQATNAWTSTGTVVDVRRTTQSDVRWSGTKLYVVTHLKAGSSNADPAMRVRRFGYTPGRTAGAGRNNAGLPMPYALSASISISRA